jgi:cytochrome P450
LNTLEFGFAPRGFALRHAARYGRTYRMAGVGGDVVFTAHPEHIRRVFAADSDTFATFAAVSLRGLFGPHSVLLTSGVTHKRQRKLLSPSLHGARLRAFGATMQELADEHVARLAPGVEFRALEFATDFTLDVIVRTVFGVSTPAQSAELRRLLSQLVQHVPPLAIFAPRLQHPWFPPWARYLRSQQEFTAWLTAKIAERRRLSDRSEDVLSLLLEARYDDGSPMDEEEIRDQLVTLLLAGHETTSIAIATVLSRVHRHPQVLARLRGALAASGTGPEEAQRLPYLSAVIDETLRIDPVVTDVARVPKQDFALDDRLTITPRHVLLVLMEALHHDPELYPKPEQFRPERFLERKYAPHEYAPFGGGVRRCLGAAFSDYETKILLATLLRRFTLRLSEERHEPRVRRNITMGPKHGVPMRVESRLRGPL